MSRFGMFFLVGGVMVTCLHIPLKAQMEIHGG